MRSWFGLFRAEDELERSRRAFLAQIDSILEKTREFRAEFADLQIKNLRERVAVLERANAINIENTVSPAVTPAIPLNFGVIGVGPAPKGWDNSFLTTPCGNGPNGWIGPDYPPAKIAIGHSEDEA